MTRPSWNEYFMEIAKLVSTRATCDRKHVGAVIVKNRQILSTGYNGSMPGVPHCDEVGHDLITLADGTQSCVRTVHAEMNAILQAAKHGVSVKEAEIYANTFPCWNCFKAIVSSGIEKIYYCDGYKPSSDNKVFLCAEESNVKLIKV